MITIKQVLHYSDTNTIEATWVEIVTPEQTIPAREIPPLVDDEGNIIEDGFTEPARVIPAVERQVKCHSYADVQMQMFRDDAKELGTDLTEHEALIALVESRIVPYVAPPTPIPTSISPRQIRQALTRKGLRAAVEAAVAASSQDLKDWWEFSTVYERNNEHVISMATALGVTDAQLDELWTLGATL